MQNSQDLSQAVLSNRGSDLLQRQMGSGQCDSQTFCGKHHDREVNFTLLREKLCVTRERDACFVDDAFMHRAGNQRMNLLAKYHLCGDFQCVQDVGAVGGIESSGEGRLSQSDVADEEFSSFVAARRSEFVKRHLGDREVQFSSALRHQLLVADYHKLGVRWVLRQLYAEVGSDAGRFAGGECESGNHGLYPASINQFYEGFFTNLDQPVLEFQFKFAVPQHVGRLAAGILAGQVRLSAPEYLCDMPTHL